MINYNNNVLLTEAPDDSCRLASLLFALAFASLAHGAVNNVVLVHGAFADGSGWKAVADILQHDGYAVYVVQEPEITFEADVLATRIVLDRSGPCVLVGHSYGGMIISEVGTHPAVRSLVYVAAFEPEVGGLQSKMPPASNSVIPARGGFVQVKPEAFPSDFAADVPRSVAQFMAISQVPISAAIFDVKATVAAWSSMPSYKLERFMSGRAKSQAIELRGSHAIFLSHPKEVASLIEKAAKAAD